MKQYTRFEVIGPSGRMIVHSGKAEASVQDQGRTLKVFLDQHYTGPISYAKDAELIQRLVDALFIVERRTNGSDDVYWDAMQSAAAAGFKPFDQ